jgi:hypothetical protein
MSPIEKYFNAEKYESLLFVFVGLAAIAGSIYFLIKIKHPFYTGMVFPLIGIALIQIIVGSTVYFRSPKDISRVNQIVQTNKSAINSEEIPRMQVVMKNFIVYRWIEIALIIIGIILYFYFQPQPLWKGIGLGLSIQSSFMLLLDYFAESRGKAYLLFLQSL